MTNHSRRYCAKADPGERFLSSFNFFFPFSITSLRTLHVIQIMGQRDNQALAMNTFSHFTNYRPCPGKNFCCTGGFFFSVPLCPSICCLHDRYTCLQHLIGRCLLSRHYRPITESRAAELTSASARHLYISESPHWFLFDLAWAAATV